MQKKNLEFLIGAYACYVQCEGNTARRLVLVGTGPLEGKLRDQVANLHLKDRVIFTGFLEGSDLAGTLKAAIGLLLVSSSEQWGLVVNEAVALGIPVILSESPGSRDALVRNLITGYVIEQGSAEGLICAMQLLGRDELNWNAMSEATVQRAWLGDVSCFADAIELVLNPHAQPASRRIAKYKTAIAKFRGI